jgi:hypothetical protein
MARKSFDANKQVGIDKDYDKGDFTTPESLVIDMLALIPIEKTDVVVDAGSGERKVWFDHIQSDNKREVELKDGADFYAYSEKVDWVVGNPPFREFIGFIFKSSEICRKGFAFLTNHSRINQITPVRLRKLEEKDFFLNHIHILSVKKWFGRYYFVIFTKESTKAIGYSTKNYGD